VTPSVPKFSAGAGVAVPVLPNSARRSRCASRTRTLARLARFAAPGSPQWWGDGMLTPKKIGTDALAAVRFPPLWSLPRSLSALDPYCPDRRWQFR